MKTIGEILDFISENNRKYLEERNSKVIETKKRIENAKLANKKLRNRIDEMNAVFEQNMKEQDEILKSTMKVMEVAIKTHDVEMAKIASDIITTVRLKDVFVGIK